MVRDEIQKIINRVPQLTIEGITYRDNTMSPRRYNEKFAKWQEDLLNSNAEQFLKTCEWLASVKKIKTINRKHTTGHLKDIADAEIGYVTKGQFIAAAIHCGFDFRYSYSEDNVYFNISEKSIKQKVNKKNEIRRF